MIALTFLGAARTVTGSKYLIETNGTRVMVDAGLFQGLKELRERNWQDLGRYGRPVLPDPTPVTGADFLLVESTYGDRLHERDDDGSRLAEIVNRTAHRGGKLIVPAFAIGRVEELLYWLRRLEAQKRIPVLPVFVDSPMASAALARYSERVQELDPELQPEMRDDKAPHDAAAPHSSDVRQRQASQERELCLFCTERFHVIASVEESKQLTASKAPSIVISSSGMAEGGRVLHHLKVALPGARNTVLFAGYQALGTRGRRLVDGEKRVKIHGEWIDVAATIESIDSMSAHADVNEIMRWLRGFGEPPLQTFIVHGEPGAQDGLGERIHAELGWNQRAPEHRQRMEM